MPDIEAQDLNNFKLGQGQPWLIIYDRWPNCTYQDQGSLAFLGFFLHPEYFRLNQLETTLCFYIYT